MKRITLLTCFLSCLLMNASVFAGLKSIDAGLKVGVKAPELTVVDNAGQAATIKQLSGEKGLILVFFRSADWCRFCKAHLLELNQYSDKLTALGYGVAAISYDAVEVLKGFATEKAIKYPLLSDQGVKTMSAYRVVNQRYQPGDEHYGIPYPGVVVIGQQGKIVHSYFYQGYKKRVKFDQLYEQLK